MGRPEPGTCPAACPAAARERAGRSSSAAAARANRRTRTARRPAPAPRPESPPTAAGRRDGSFDHLAAHQELRQGNGAGETQQGDDQARTDVEKAAGRSEERGVGKGCVRTWNCRWSPYPLKKKKIIIN